MVPCWRCWALLPSWLGGTGRYEAWESDAKDVKPYSFKVDGRWLDILLMTFSFGMLLFLFTRF
jgi:hypothetical protein